MINNKTVVIVGAGASHDLGLPLGPELQIQVADQLGNRDSELWSFFRSAAENLFTTKGKAGVQAFITLCGLAQQLQSSTSIDNFLDQHKDQPEVVAAAKIVVAYVLADAEKNSKLRGREDKADLIMQNRSYFMFPLLNIAVRGHQAENIRKSLENLTFVIFNYDRCVERYLRAWLLFRFGPKAIENILQEKFVHVYGSLGNYFDPEVHNPFEYEGRLAFQNPHFELPPYVDRLKVFTEQEDSETREKINAVVDEAKTLIFLGFGFEEQNMRFFDVSGENKKVFATLYGLSVQNQSFVTDYLNNQFSNSLRSVQYVDGKSSKLFDDCYHPITRAVGSL